MAGNSPANESVLPATQVLRILEKMYDGKFWNVNALANATALNDQAVRNRLEDMIDQKWVEKETVGNAHHYRITARALLRPSLAAHVLVKDAVKDEIERLTKEVILKIMKELGKQNDQK